MGGVTGQLVVYQHDGYNHDYNYGRITHTRPAHTLSTLDLASKAGDRSLEVQARGGIVVHVLLHRRRRRTSLRQCLLLDLAAGLGSLSRGG